VTGKARSNIRHFLKSQRRSESVALGERLLDKALSSLGRSIDDIEQDRIDLLLEETSLESIEDVMEDIGLGNRMASLVARRLLVANRDTDIDLEAFGDEAPLAIKGTEGVVVNFAKCCNPIPGDPIVGNTSSGRGLVIHTATCKNVQNIREDAEKCVILSWDKDIDSEFSVDLRLYLENRKGVVAELASAITQADANIEGISVEDRDARLSVTQIQISVQGRKHLARVMRRLRAIPGVNKIVRIKN
jgi:(p)ppGpp synthase/HD superfamily hydrolase